MLRTPNWLALAFACALASRGSTTDRGPDVQAASLNLAPALDAYAAGRFDDARRMFERVTDAEARNLRAEWTLGGLAWINAAPGDRRYRTLVAAALALESEAVRAERGDWAPVGPAACAPPVSSVTGRAGGGGKDKAKPPPPPAVCVVEWARERLVERGSPDAAEHAWFTAAIALAEGVRDLRYLYTPIDPARQPPVLPGLTDRALERFPGDVRFRLDRAIAAAARFGITTDGVTRTPAPSLQPPLIVINRGTGPPLVSRASNDRLGARGAAIADLTDLGDDPVVGAEARLQLGYLLWATGNDAAARTELTAAARLARDTDLKYLALFLRGMAAQSAGDAPGAVDAYTAALDARPHSQSATLALAALQLQRGQIAQADELARASFAGRPGDDDPWRLFLYGRYPELPAFLTALRAAVTR